MTGPKLIEYNVRFGDPEAEVILARLTDDVLPLLEACAKGSFRGKSPVFSTEAALAVVMAATGVSRRPVRGGRIRGLENAESVEGVTVFQAATRQVGDEIVSDGGRVLAITARGRTVLEAKDRAYAAVDCIDWSEGFCRREMGGVRPDGKLSLNAGGSQLRDSLSAQRCNRTGRRRSAASFMCLLLRGSTK